MTEMAPQHPCVDSKSPEEETPSKLDLSSKLSEADKSTKRAPESPLLEEEIPKKKLRTAEGPLTKQGSTANQASNKSLSHLLSWKDEISKQKSPAADSFKLISVKSIVDSSLQDHGQNLQAILIDASWRSPEDSYITEFKKLRLSDKLMSNGIVFVWAEKQDMSEVMSHLESMGFVYVEIFSFILLSVQKILEAETKKNKEKPKVKTILDFFQKKDTNKSQTKQQSLPAKNLFITPSKDLPDIDPALAICSENSDYFRKGKKNLIMMRKVNKKETLELRHQRTSDVYFALYDQKLQKIDDSSYQCIYKMIETLLIKANYQQGQALKMMQLWANPSCPRSGWIKVSQTQS